MEYFYLNINIYYSNIYNLTNLNYLFLFIIFFLGVYFSEIYSVVSCIIFFMITTFKNFRLDKINLVIIIYVLLISALYFQALNVDQLKEVIIFVIGPFIFFFLGKFNNNFRFGNKVITFFTLSLFVYCCILFFRDTQGEFSLNLFQNYYYGSRNKLFYKSEIEGYFINETNLSLLILTSLFLLFFSRIKNLLKVLIYPILVLMILMTSSRTAIFTIIFLLVIYLFKNKRFKFNLKRFIFLGFIVSLLILFQGYYFQFINITFERFIRFFVEYSSQDANLGLAGRIIHYQNAINYSDNLFNFNGYRFLLNNFGFTSHNEVLGHASSFGIIPTLLYFFIYFLLSKKSINNFKKGAFKYYLDIIYCFIISYSIVGLTENIYVSNTQWIYVMMFIFGIANKNHYHVEKTVSFNS